MKYIPPALATAALILVAWSGVAQGQVLGSLEVWGNNSYGECTVPDPNLGFTAVDLGGTHVLGLRFDGTIVAWGNNAFGQCAVPAPNTGFIAVSAGDSHSAGLKSDGSIVGWGANGYGECTVPEPNTGFVAVATGSTHTLGLKSDHTAVAWGNNWDGQCNVPSPNTDFVALATTHRHNLGLRSDGSIVAWGWNGNGQCNVPSPNTGFTAVAAGGYHSLGLKSDGSIDAWGANFYGQLDVPPPNSGFVAVAAGFMHSMGLKADGSLVVWGLDSQGVLNPPAPNSGYLAISAHGQKNAAVRLTGEPLLLSVADVGNDQGRQVRLSWLRSPRDAVGMDPFITSYGIFRRQDESRLEGWDYLLSVPANCEAYYATVVPTLCDSTAAGGACYSTFLVRAMTGAPSVFYDSPPDSGYSIDNIVPPVPTDFEVVYGSSVALSWDASPAPDFAWFDVHRGTTPGFEPSPANLVYQTQGLTWTDPAGTSGDFYKLIAVDDAGNRSLPAVQEGLTGIDSAAGSLRTTLVGNVPNPFNPATTIVFTLARAEPVSLRIFDLAGRLVCDLVGGELREAGRHEVSWRGIDDAGRAVASGTYFCRLAAGEDVQTHRMSLTR